MAYRWRRTRIPGAFTDGRGADRLFGRGRREPISADTWQQKIPLSSGSNPVVGLAQPLKCVFVEMVDWFLLLRPQRDTRYPSAGDPFLFSGGPDDRQITCGISSFFLFFSLSIFIWFHCVIVCGPQPLPDGSQTRTQTHSALLHP